MRGMNANPFKISSSNKLTASSALLVGYDGGNRTGIISPAYSANTSTSVTPITPMTPLTTPRTPAQALLGRLMMKNDSGHHVRPPLSSMNHHHVHYNGSSSHHVRFQDEHDQHQQRLLALKMFSNFLDTAESTLEDIVKRENSGCQVIGPSIVRMCNDLAEHIFEVTKEISREKELRIEQFEQALSVDDLTLLEEGESVEKTDAENATYNTAKALSSTHPDFKGGTTTIDNSLTYSSSHEDIINSMSTAQTLLLDMSAALRAVTQEEAQELGKVAVEVGQMFVRSLRLVQFSMIQTTVFNESEPSTSLFQDKREASTINTLTQSSKQHRVTWLNSKFNGHGNSGLGPLVEILGEEEKKDENGVNYVGTPPKDSTPKSTPHSSPIFSSPSRMSPTIVNDAINDTQGRLRVLWPPVCPAIIEASKHCASCAINHPIPATAVGIICGPSAVVTALLVGPPVLIVDWAIQSTYDALSDTPVIENLEKSAASAFQVARLAVLCSKLLVKQGISVGDRQIKRRGGIGKICTDTLEEAVDMVMHPIETIGMVWEGLFWIGGAVRDSAVFVKEAACGGEIRMDIH